MHIHHQTAVRLIKLMQFTVAYKIKKRDLIKTVPERLYMSYKTTDSHASVLATDSLSDVKAKKE